MTLSTRRSIASIRFAHGSSAPLPGPTRVSCSTPPDPVQNHRPTNGDSWVTAERQAPYGAAVTTRRFPRQSG